MSKSSPKRKRSTAKNRNSSKLHIRRSQAGQRKAKPRPVFEWFERRGTMVYSEDRGPGTARLIRECSSVTEAESEVRRNNDAYNVELERLIKTKWAKKAAAVPEGDLDCACCEMLDVQRHADIHHHAKHEAYRRELDRRMYEDSHVGCYR